MRGSATTIVGWLVVAGLVLSACGVRHESNYSATHFYVPSANMAPTLKIGQVITVRPVATSARLKRGQIVLWHTPAGYDCGGQLPRFVFERVIGLPGETISLNEGRVFINGAKLTESWLPHSEQDTTYPSKLDIASSLSMPFLVPRSSYFVMADNRSDSCDSRYWGPIRGIKAYGVMAGVDSTASS